MRRREALGGASLAFVLLTLARQVGAQAPESAAASPAPAPDAPPAASPAPASPPPPPARPEDLPRARKLHAAGERFYQQGDYPSALDAFEQAYAASARPNLLLSQARTHRKLLFATGLAHHKGKAIELYRRFLAVAPRSELTVAATDEIASLGPPEAPTPSDAASNPPGATPPPPVVEAPRARTTLAIDSTAEGAMISIDGGQAKPPQLRAEVAPGRHLVRVEAPGYVPREVTILAIPDQITPETIELEEKDGVVQVRTASADLLVHVDGQPMGRARSFSLEPGEHFVSVTGSGKQSLGARVVVKRGGRATVSFEPEVTTQRTTSIALLAVGGVGLVAGGVTLGLAIDRDSRAVAIDAERQAGSIDDGDFGEYEELQGERNTLRAAGLVTTLASASIGIVGLGLYLVDSPDPIAPPSDGGAPLGPRPPPRTSPAELVLAPSLGPSFGGLCARGAF